MSNIAARNTDQIRYWNDAAGSKWATLQDGLDAQLAPYGERVLDAVSVRAGERVLDVGCGCGATTLALAKRVGPRGHVTGVDISAPMLARAQERGTLEGVSNVTWVQSDAQVHPFLESSFEVVCSRFGVMFFGEPVEAFANLRRSLVPRGRIGFVCWQSLDRNPWMAIPAAAVAPFVTMPPRPPPGSPGPFAFADRDALARIMNDAGYRSVAIDPWDSTIIIGGQKDLDAATDFAIQFGPAASALREAPADAVSRARNAARDALAPYHTPEGVRLATAVWIVTATE